MVARARGEDTHSEPKSSDEEEEEEGDVTPPPLSPPRETLPSFNDILSREVRVVIGVHQPKQIWTKTGPSAGMPL
jgi:hypothetical protein